MHLAELTSLSWKKHILSVKLQTSIGASPMATTHYKELLNERIMLIQASNILDIVRCMNADVLDSGRHTSIEN